MKAYQWLTLSAAIVFTVFEDLLFTQASGIISPVDTQAALTVPGAEPATSLSCEPRGRNSPAKSGEAP